MNDDMSIEEALDHIKERLENYENESPEIQMMLRSATKMIVEKYEMALSHRQEIERARAERDRVTKQQRKLVRDQEIPKWCIENLKTGMIVKVRSKSRTPYRQIEFITPATKTKEEAKLTGRHCSYVRRRDPETKERRYDFVLEKYITDHVLRNVQGIVMGTNQDGSPRVVPIMDLIEGEHNA